jgi:hypothetical protein
MSLKLFFKSLSDDQLEFMCHHYVHNWINEELQRSNRLLSKYQVEQKLDYIKQNQAGSITNREQAFSYDNISRIGIESRGTKSSKQLPSYMAPTIVKMNKH